MAVPGAAYGTQFGPILGQTTGLAVNQGVATTVALAALNAGWCARFIATSTKDIKSVKVNWSSVSAPGQVTVRIETIDATTGQPSGTLYDASAVMTGQTPTAGWQTFTFASLPTTGLTIGAEYGLVIETTTSGTTQTIRSSVTSNQRESNYPTLVLTSADATTYTAVNYSTPICSFIMEDDTEDPMGCCPIATVTANDIHGTNATAAKVVVPVTMSLAGIRVLLLKNGTPAGDIRVRIFNSGDSVVSNTTVTVDKDSVTTGVLGMLFPLDALPSLAAGTYRIVFDSASSANASNCWRIHSLNAVTAASIASGFTLSTTADVTATPPTWTDTTTATVPVWMIVDSLSGGGGGAGSTYAMWNH